MVDAIDGKEFINIVENRKYGDNFINQLFIELKMEFSNMKGFSIRNLYRIR